MGEESRETSADEPLDLVVRLRAAADKSANGGGDWYQLIHRCREAADHIEKSDRPRPSQPHVNAVGHYRNLAISLGATPEQMLNTFDRDLCRNGLNFERGDYTIKDSCGDLAEVWEQVDRMADALRALQAWDMLTLLSDGSGCATHDAPWARKLIADALAGVQ